jgi:UDP-perosamine 4-acetyltransferase
MRRIAIAGSTELAERLIHYFETSDFAKVVGLFDDFVPAGTTRHERPLLGPMTEIPAFFRDGRFDSVAIGVGYRQREFRRRLFEELRARDVPVTTFVHPSAHVEPSVRIGAGAIVLVDCTIDLAAELGENVLLSTRGFVSHHVRIGAHSYCAPAVQLAGHTQVGEGCFLGIGTTTIEGIRIGENASTAAGAVLIRDVPPGALVGGVPARDLRPGDPPSGRH